VAEHVDGDPGEQVEIAVSVGIPDVATVTSGQDRLRATEHTHHRLRV